MTVTRNVVDVSRFNEGAVLPYELRLQDFQMAMQDVHDFFHDVYSQPLPERARRYAYALDVPQ